MIVRLPETEFLKSEVAEWAWNSHMWVEYERGYYKCKWCGAVCGTEVSIGEDYMLCRKNPFIKKLLT
jgi:hypothetical protein